MINKFRKLPMAVQVSSAGMLIPIVSLLPLPNLDKSIIMLGLLGLQALIIYEYCLSIEERKKKK